MCRILSSKTAFYCLFIGLFFFAKNTSTCAQLWQGYTGPRGIIQLNHVHAQQSLMSRRQHKHAFMSIVMGPSSDHRISDNIKPKINLADIWIGHAVSLSKSIFGNTKTKQLPPVHDISREVIEMFLSFVNRLLTNIERFEDHLNEMIKYVQDLNANVTKSKGFPGTNDLEYSEFKPDVEDLNKHLSELKPRLTHIHQSQEYIKSVAEELSTDLAQNKHGSEHNMSTYSDAKQLFTRFEQFVSECTEHILLYLHPDILEFLHNVLHIQKLVNQRIPATKNDNEGLLQAKFVNTSLMNFPGFVDKPRLSTNLLSYKTNSESSLLTHLESTVKLRKSLVNVDSDLNWNIILILNLNITFPKYMIFHIVILFLIIGITIASLCIFCTYSNVLKLSHAIINWISSSKQTMLLYLLENLLLCLLPSRMQCILEERAKFNEMTYPIFQIITWQYILVLIAVLLIQSNLSHFLRAICYNQYIGSHLQGPNKTPHYCKAEEKAGVKFLCHHILKCGYHGLEYKIPDHGITLRFPEGIVDKWEILYLEVGVVNMYGPFTFPKDVQPISPVLWICCLDENVAFKKKFEVILPHYLQSLTDEDTKLYNIRFSKASHFPTETDQTGLQYDFHACEANFQQKCDPNDYQNYGTLLADHCCFYCLLANITPQITLDAGYCLVRLESTSPAGNDIVRSEIHFVVIFCLDTCMSALGIQFPRNKGYNIQSWKYFHFKDDPQGPHIKFLVPKEHKDCVIGLDPSTAKITAKDVNNWDNSLSTMIDWHDKKIYPPRVVMTIMPKSTENRVFVLPVTVDGCSGECQLDVDLTFPLGMYTHNKVDSSSSPLLKPVNLSVLLEELLPLASNWENIGIFLGIDDGILLTIKVDEQKAQGKLREMLRAWLRQVDPTPPTWTAIIKAVGLIDEARANELTSKYCPNYSP